MRWMLARRRSLARELRHQELPRCLSAVCLCAGRALRAVLGYIERASAHPRSKICMWDPEFCEHVAPTPEARECLLAAGFVALETNDASGTPYLAHRRIPPRMLRAMALELKRQAAELEGHGRYCQ